MKQKNSTESTDVPEGSTKLRDRVLWRTTAGSTRIFNACFSIGDKQAPLFCLHADIINCSDWLVRIW